MPDTEGNTTPKDDGGPDFLQASKLIAQVHSRLNAHNLLNAYSAHCLEHDEDDAQSPVPRTHYITLHITITQSQWPDTVALTKALARYSGSGLSGTTS